MGLVLFLIVTMSDIWSVARFICPLNSYKSSYMIYPLTPSFFVTLFIILFIAKAFRMFIIAGWMNMIV